MTDWSADFVGRDYQDFPSEERTVGDALRALLQRQHKHHARTHIERTWGLDPKTARNVVTSGHVSERTLTKAARAERWALWAALGEELFGESYDQHLQGVIDDTIAKAERAKARRDHVRSLEARASAVVNLHSRDVALRER